MASVLARWITLVLALAGPSVLLAASPACAASQTSDRSLGSSLSDLRGDPQSNMVVKAREMVYDNDRNTVSALGTVQIYYDGRTLQADRVIYDRTSSRVHASGTVRITEADGTVSTADEADLTDDFHDGFVNSVRLRTPQNTRFAAARAERTDGTITVFENGVYTACEPCKDHPEKPPEWQVKAARIIHNDQEKMIYFEDAHFEFFGVPIAYLPYLSTPDPTVKRKSGFLAPRLYYGSELGVGASVPYFWALAPNYDVTITPGATSRQGPILEGEFRHRLETGSYLVHAAGVVQADPNAFEGPGDKTFRGTLDTRGEFWLNEHFLWGWTGTAVSDRSFRDDYSIDSSRASEAISSLYLTGMGNRSWFDARLYYFLSLTKHDELTTDGAVSGTFQRLQPIVHPVVDYDYIVDHPVLGGELGWTANLTSLTRTDADYDYIGGLDRLTLADGKTVPVAADGTLVTCDGSTQRTPRANCIQRGIDGTYTRGSIDLHWKREMVDPLGQVWTPFASVRGDLASLQLDDSGTPRQFVNDRDDVMARALPAVGLEYRYPLVSTASWGTQVIEPIGEVIVRAHRWQTGDWPNEDAQSLVFDDVNLFNPDKFSGFDRVEDGSRANIGLQYTLTTAGGGFYNALVGQSYALSDRNAYSVGDMANTGLDSGLETTRSDYVGRVYAQPWRNLSLSTSARVSQDDFEIERLDIGAASTIGRFTGTAIYGNYAPQPSLGLARRAGVLGEGTFKLTDYWNALGGASYDIDDRRFSSRFVGLSYIDECLSFGLRLARRYDENEDKNDTRVMFQLSLKTLGTRGVKDEDDEALTRTPAAFQVQTSR